MTRAAATLLDTGDRLPDMTLELISGESLTIPGDLKEGYAVLLFYRFDR